ncbi:hypothetical protein PS862_01347 [Pseudomonas fluorescens]|uniref:Uncharacterized protein n=1 Tax=Pseudomonas fluorescens TaxID=294 RepID=A0A5E7I5V4_PSEFL|nr:hypothetical protein PS862_01347 [Pseudomonas fluorescens]
MTHTQVSSDSMIIPYTDHADAASTLTDIRQRQTDALFSLQELHQKHNSLLPLHRQENRFQLNKRSFIDANPLPTGKANFYRGNAIMLMKLSNQLILHR